VQSVTPKPPRRVLVRDLEVMASVGLFEVEHRYEQRIIVNLDLRVQDDYDGISERIGDVVDYGALVTGVERVVASRHFKLVETLAERIAEGCLQDARVLTAIVRIEKPDILQACKAVGIEIERSRA
jgi:7,8-dihydroneopterin aldolase/epimerase/oxygenase